MKILVADDSKTTRALLTETLKKFGHEVIVAENGQQAIALFQTNRPDLIILDVVMEGLDGFECAKRIRALDVKEWIPIIFLSGAVDDENIELGINSGGDDYLTKPYSEITLAAKIKAMQRIADMRAQLFEMTKKLSTLSSTDSLTGIYNRLMFDRVIKEKISYANRHKKKLALLFIDIDKFKTINDTLGHHVGDLLLTEAASRLKECLRLEDFIARIGGDEFAIIVSEFNEDNVAGEIAKKIINRFALPFNLAGNTLHISTSIGISVFNPGEGHAESLINHADIAMYHAKQSGRNNFQFFTSELQQSHIKKVSIENALKSALDNHEIGVTYQPIIDLHDQRIVKVEAFATWNSPEHGLISPNVFIPLAEEIGVIDNIGAYVLRKACVDGGNWVKDNCRGFKLSINLSPKQLLQKDFPTIIKSILEACELPPEMLEFELTETSALIYSNLSEQVLNQIHEMGIDVTLDDFGSGYSSLSHLKRLPISSIKIDKAFIRDLEADPNSGTIVKSLITLGKSLDYDVVAEGIENKKQLEFLIANQCPMGQGYFLSKPLSHADITQLLKQKTRQPIAEK